MPNLLSRIVAFLLMFCFLADLASAGAVVPAASQLRFERSLFTHQAVVQPAIEFPLRPSATRQQAFAIRRAAEQPGYSRRRFARVLAGMTATVPAVAGTGNDAPSTTNIVIPRFTEVEKQIIREEIGFIVQTYAPRLAGTEEDIFQKFLVRSSYLQDTLVDVSKWAAVGLAVVSAGKAVGSMRRRDFLKSAAWGAGIGYFGRTYKAYDRLIDKDAAIAGETEFQREGEIGIARHRIDSLTYFRLVIAHELFHFLGHLDIMLRHAIYANSYALLRVLQTEGFDGLKEVGILPGTPDSVNTQSLTYAYLLGESIARSSETPEDRTGQLMRDVRQIFNLPDFNADTLGDGGLPWVYFYGIAHGSLAFHEANGNFPNAYKRIGEAALGRRPDWPWWGVTREGATINLRAWTWLYGSLYAATVAVSVALSLTFKRVAQRAGRFRWSRNGARGILAGGLAFGFLTMHWPLHGDLFHLLNSIVFQIRYESLSHIGRLWIVFSQEFKAVTPTQQADHWLILVMTSAVIGTITTWVLNFLTIIRRPRDLSEGV